MARCGRTNLAGGGGVGSDETTATKDKVLKDYTYLGTDTDDEIGTGTIESMEGTTVTPSASQQTVSTSGKYLTGDVIVSAVANLTAANIANGKVVGGTTGTYKGLGNATAAQVLAGKTFSTASLSNTAGTMINYSGYTSTSNYTSGTFKSGTTGYIFVVPGGTGYYSNATYLRIPATNLSAANIKKGVKILGITGTWEGYATSPLYLYNKGTWGGLSTTGTTTVSSTDRYATVKADKFCWGYTGYGEGSAIILSLFRLNQSFNLTNYNYIKVVECGASLNDVTNRTDLGNTICKDGYICVGVSSSALSSVSAPSSVTTKPTGLSAYSYGNGTVVLDVSSLSGNYWIYFGGVRKQGTSAMFNGLNQVFVSTS